MRKICGLFIVASLYAAAACGASPVWKVSRNGFHLYLGGTIHLLSAEDYPLPISFENAYYEAQEVVFEVDIEALKSPEFMQKMMLRNMYAGDDDITKHLQPQTLTKLKEYLQSRNMTLEPLKKMKPGFLAIMLASVEMRRIGMGESGVDQFFSDKAVRDGKTRSALETVDEQLDFISALGDEIEDQVIQHSLDELDTMREIVTGMKQAWRSGDMHALAELSLAEWKDEFPKLYQELLVDRNKNWMPRIRAMLENTPTEFVLVGALHLLGDDGLLEKLRNSGCRIEQME
jgi:uncharacterized protein